MKRLCCNDEVHMVNWAKGDFMEILRNGGEACQCILKTEGEKYGLSIATFNNLIWPGGGPCGDPEKRGPLHLERG